MDEEALLKHLQAGSTRKERVNQQDISMPEKLDFKEENRKRPIAIEKARYGDKKERHNQERMKCKLKGEHKIQT